jgi:hypothetical protein
VSGVTKGDGAKGYGVGFRVLTLTIWEDDRECYTKGCSREVVEMLQLLLLGCGDLATEEEEEDLVAGKYVR